MINYQIEGGNLPVVICYPEAGQTLCTESGAMSWMSPNMQMTTNTGGGVKKMFGRMFSGESLFMNEYTAQGGQGMIAFASSFPGTIIPYQVTPNNGIIVQKRGFLAMVLLEIDGYCKEYNLGVGQSIIVDTGYLAAMTDTCTMDIQMIQGAKNVFFGGEGLFNTVITGPGKVYIQSMPAINTAQSLSPYLRTGNDNGGGFNISFGD